jgi:CBS domain-containing protein
VLVGGRAGWTAQGEPTEGQVGDRRRISQYLEPTASVDIDATIGDASRVAGDAPSIAVVGPGDVLLGALARTALRLPEDTRVEDAMISAPSTIRPELRIDEVAEQLRNDGLDHVYVTRVDGTLLGLVITEKLHA